VDDETYYQYVEEKLRVAVKNPLPQSEWGFQTGSRILKNKRKSNRTFLRNTWSLPKKPRESWGGEHTAAGLKEDKKRRFLPLYPVTRKPQG